MKQVKVKSVENYEDKQGKHLVCKGKLVLIRTGLINAILQIPNNFEGFDYYKPIIISETEEIEVGDKFITEQNHIFICTSKDDNCIKFFKEGLEDDGYEYTTTNGRKILVLPEQFSTKQLQAIVDGKMKDGDEVYVECEGYNRSTTWEYDEPEMYIIAKFLPEPGHIKLFPVKKEETWDDIIERFTENKFFDEHNTYDYLIYSDLEEFLKKNYNPPTRK